MSHVPAEPILTSRRPATPDPERGWVTCAFCGGTGIDPFGIMSELSTCSRCMGHGIVYVRPPTCVALTAGEPGDTKPMPVRFAKEPAWSLDRREPC